MAESSESNLELDSASKNLDNTTFGLSSGSDKDSETFIAFYDTWAQDYEKVLTRASLCLLCVLRNN